MTSSRSLMHVPGSPELKKRAAKQASGFLFGPADASPQAAIDVPWLHVHIDGVLTRLPMVAYQCSRTVCCLFVEPSKASEMDMYAHLQALVKPKMEELDAELQAKQASLAALSEQFPPEAQYKYVYFNHVNRAEKSTFLPLLKSERSGRVGSKLSPEEQAACRSSEVRIMGDMHEDFVLGGPQHDCEIIAQTASGPWVVGRQTESREFFVNLTNKSSANLTEIQGDIRILNGSTFVHICLRVQMKSASSRQRNSETSSCSTNDVLTQCMLSQSIVSRPQGQADARVHM